MLSVKADKLLTCNLYNVLSGESTVIILFAFVVFLTSAILPFIDVRYIVAVLEVVGTYTIYSFLSSSFAIFSSSYSTVNSISISVGVAMM